MMVISNLFFEFFNNVFLYYATFLFVSYLLIAVLSASELKAYIKKNKYFRYKTIRSYEILPSVSIIAPCYNEEKGIVENIRSLLSLQYPRVEVIIVNDGSQDNSLEKAINSYELVKVDYAHNETIQTAKIRGIYKSLNNAFSNLIFVDKENGGKADALNAGINVSRSDLFLAIDVDSIIEPDGIMRMVKPFMEDSGNKRVIASGGVIRVANSCEVKDGRIVKVRYPKNLWAKFQVLEYFRAFTLGRMAWSRINGLLIISGAFGMFDKKLAQTVGGYDTSTVGEDLELVVRMRKYMHRVAKEQYKIAFIPDPLCWTEVPSTVKILSRQRNRWARGSIETVIKHKNMYLNPKYGRIGMISFPYWVLFEWFAPILETIGIVYFLVALSLGMVNYQIFFLLLLFVFSFSLAFSSFAVFYETFLFNRYKGARFLLKIILIAMAEMVIFHPMNVYFSLKGNYDFFFRKNKKGWGVMTRTGFGAKQAN
ncbi:MAG: glycosyltransferase family 2 protein [Bacteroidales bacterium]|nr:glycosyltransferase family 2 protein [Bacteroidales bacterium]